MIEIPDENPDLETVMINDNETVESEYVNKNVIMYIGGITALSDQNIL